MAIRGRVGPFEHVLVLCTGNICRSPMAEGLLRARIGSRGMEVESAGTNALVGAPADPLAVAVMAENGYDISAHRARQANARMLSHADLILAAEWEHQRWVTALLPHVKARVFRLAYWSGNEDIPDPYRQPRTAFEDAFARLKEACATWIPETI